MRRTPPRGRLVRCVVCGLWGAARRMFRTSAGYYHSAHVIDSYEVRPVSPSEPD